MSQKSSLLQSAKSVPLVLTANSASSESASHHPHLEGTEGMLDCAHAHRLRALIETPLHRFEQRARVPIA
jgi:hypothetical protein